MHSRGLALTAVFAMISACGLDLVGKGDIPESGSPGASGPTDEDASPHGAMGLFVAGDSGQPADGNVPVVRRAPTDAGDDTTTSSDAARDAGGGGSSATLDSGGDADTPCGRLLQCCPRLLVPPLALACIAAAVQDAGESTCEATLASLVDAGVCP
jgi:hypothetical protein